MRTLQDFTVHLWLYLAGQVYSLNSTFFISDQAFYLLASLIF